MAARIAFFGMESGFSAICLRALLHSELRPHIVVIGVDKPPWQRGPRVDWLPARPSRFERFFGVGPEQPAEHEALSAAAAAARIDVLKTSEVGAVRSRGRIADARPDALVVASFPTLLPESVLSLAPLGGLNLHPGALPEQRGPAPLFWTLKRGEPSLRFAIHVLARGEDDGDLVSTGSMPFPPGTHGAEILRGLATVAAPYLLEALRDLAEGRLERTPQRRAGIGRCPRPSFRDGRVETDRSAEAVFTFVGGCVGSYPIFVECGGDRFFIARALSYDLSAKLPSEFFLSGDRLLLACTPGVVELELRADGAIFTADYVEPPNR